MGGLILIAIGSIVPIILFNWFMRRYGGVASFDEGFQLQARIPKNEYREYVDSQKHNDSVDPS